MAATAIPLDLPSFQQDISPAILAARPCDAKHWRQIEPSVQHLALQHADRLAALDAEARIATLAKLADVIDRVRTRVRNAPVLGPGRRIVGLLDPATGLGPKEITTIAEAYGGITAIFKKDEDGETLETVADAFLAAVREAAAGPMKGVLHVSDEPLVSKDFACTDQSTSIDSSLTMVMGDDMVKVVAWYDNEWGYSQRVVDLAELTAQKWE